MAEAALVEPKIKSGADLLALLDERLGDIFAAFWYHDPETEDWQLVIGSDVVDHEGPTAANRRLIEALPRFADGFVNWTSALPDISPLEIQLVGRRHPLVEMLRTLSTQPMTSRAPLHIHQALLRERYVDDAYVYRNVIRPSFTPSAEANYPPTVALSSPVHRKRRRKPKEEG